MNKPFTAGHIYRSGLSMNFSKEHEACALCEKPFVGGRTQKVCDTCRSGPAFDKWYRRNSERYRLAYVERSKDRERFGE